MSSFLHLLRREFWENRGAFFKTYLVVGCILVAFALMGWITTANFISEVDGDRFFLKNGVQQLEQLDKEELRTGVRLGLLGLSELLNTILFFVVLFYLLGSLYDDRKDRSILFWKSLPVSDAATVLSKLVAATVLAPLVMIGVMALTQIALGLVGAAMLLWAGTNPFKLFWLVPEGPIFWLSQVGTYFIYGLWMLPIWGWLLFCSAYARSKPFLWATAIPVGSIIMLTWVQTFFPSIRLGSTLANWFFERFLGSQIITLGIHVDIDSGRPNWLDISSSDNAFGAVPWSRLADLELWLGVAIGAALITAAIWIRRYRDESI